MDPFTHALTSYALERAGLRRVSRFALPILLVAGVAADLDLLSQFVGANAYFRYHYAVLHSLLGSAILVVVVAGAFCIFGRGAKRPPLRFSRVIILCLIAAALHVLLDYFGAEGVQLLWPFHIHWFSLDWLPELDPWIIALLLIGSLVPALFHLITEEISSRKHKRGASTGAIVALALMAAYIAGRAVLHHSAIQTLLEHDYHGAAPLVAGAFPDSDSPLVWHGVIDTTNTIEVVDVPVGIAGSFNPPFNPPFNPMSSLTHFKPPSSPELDAARRAPLAAEFLRYARFPLANLQTISGGSIVALRDWRFAEDSPSSANLTVVIQLDNAQHLQDEHLEFPPPSPPK